MPKMNGIEMLKEIKKISPNQEILIHSALHKNYYSMEAKNLDINGAIQKPLDMMVFINVLLESINRIQIESNLLPK